MSEDRNRPCYKSHVHEVQGSVQNSGCCEHAHNHRFAAVSGEPIPCDGSHVHEICFRTDSCDGHIHEFSGRSGPAVEVGCGKHVHFAKAVTSMDGNPRHRHEFTVASLIEDPTCEQ